MPPGVKF